MVFTVAQTTAFFINEIGRTYAQLQAEGVTTINNLGMMNGKAIDAIADNLRKPTDCIPNPDPDTPEGSTIPRPPYVFGAVSRMKLLITCEAVRYYEMVG